MFQIMTFSLLLFTFFPRFRAFFSFKFSKCGRHLSALSTRMHRHTHSDTGFILFKSHAAHNTFASITFLSSVFFCVHIRAVWLVRWLVGLVSLRNALWKRAHKRKKLSNFFKAKLRMTLVLHFTIYFKTPFLNLCVVRAFSTSITSTSIPSATTTTATLVFWCMHKSEPIKKQAE